MLNKISKPEDKALDKAIYVLENKLHELKVYPYKDIHDYIQSLELALNILKKHRANYSADDCMLSKL